MTPIQPRKCVFFDRDGIVNESPGPGRYVTRREDFHVLPEFIESLRKARQHGYCAVIITNQRAVAKGLITVAALEQIHILLEDLLWKEHSLSLLDIAYCPHETGVCQCRKPLPGMLTGMARRHGIDLRASWMIGDSSTDIEAGRRAGCRTILAGTGAPGEGADRQAPSMRELPALLDEVL